MQVLKERIESMPKFHQIEILRLLKQFPTVYTNENNNGSFINLTELGEPVIKKLMDYSDYVSEQQKQLVNGEIEKNQLEKDFFHDKK